MLNNKNYKNDSGIDWLYARALFAFTREGDSENAKRELKIALNSNKFVPEYIAGSKAIPNVLPDSVIWGGRDEAFCYADRALKSWKKISGAIEWLKIKNYGCQMSDNSVHYKVTGGRKCDL